MNSKIYVISNCNYKSKACDFDELNESVREMINEEIDEINYHYSNSEIEDETNGLKEYIYNLGKYEMIARTKTMEIIEVIEFLELINNRYDYFEEERFVLKEVNVNENHHNEMKLCIDRIEINDLFLFVNSEFNIKNV